jgi:hypothetical protein
MVTANPLIVRQARVTVTVGDDTIQQSTEQLSAGTSTLYGPSAILTGAATGAAGPNGTVYTWTQQRMQLHIVAGGKQFNTCDLLVYGLPKATMNALSRLYLTPMNVRPQDTVKVEVWNGSQYVPLFFGSIQWAAPKGSSMPNVPLLISSNACTALQQTAPPPYSASGTLKLTDVLTAVLTSAGFTLNAPAAFASYTITNPRASGSLQDQIKAILSNYPDIAWDISLQQLILRQVGATLSGVDPITIGPTTGMKGSPDYSTSGVTVATVFNPLITLGATITLDTVFTYATKAQWQVAAIEHILEPNVPNGRWDTQLAARGIPNFNGSGTGTDS